MDIIVITGERASGKSTFCSHLAALCQKSKISMAGFITHTKRGDSLCLELLENNEKLPLAKYGTPSQNDSSIQIGPWTFNNSTVALGNQSLKESPPAHLLVLDELGPLEFFKNSGWQEGLKRLDRGEDSIALVVIRPSLVSSFIDKNPSAQILNLKGNFHESKQREKEVYDKILNLSQGLQ